MSSYKRLQINVRFDPISPYTNITSVYFPVLWIEEVMCTTRELSLLISGIPGRRTYCEASKRIQIKGVCCATGSQVWADRGIRSSWRACSYYYYFCYACCSVGNSRRTPAASWKHRRMRDSLIYSTFVTALSTKITSNTLRCLQEGSPQVATRP
jgi:hypothetical protein